jgi:hypothetical protein
VKEPGGRSLKQRRAHSQNVCHDLTSILCNPGIFLQTTTEYRKLQQL